MIVEEDANLRMPLGQFQFIKMSWGTLVTNYTITLGE